MSRKHDNSCDLCGEYFGTKKSLKDHNRHYHNESECEENDETQNLETKQDEHDRKKKKNARN